jgi:hypothetical protein
LGDHEPVIAPIGSFVEFHENEDEEPNFQVGLLVPSSDDHKIQKEQQQISHAELDQRETLSLHIPAVVREQFD